MKNLLADIPHKILKDSQDSDVENLSQLQYLLFTYWPAQCTQVVNLNHEHAHPVAAGRQAGWICALDDLNSNLEGTVYICKF